MINTISKLSCADFQAHLPDLIASHDDLSIHPHFQDCVDCRALLADLEAIAEAARQLFPTVEPPDRLWQHIEAAMKGSDRMN